VEVQRHPILALWAVPRSGSTAFERMMMERNDHHVIDEPFSAHYYFGEEKVSGRFDDVEPNCTPEGILASLEHAARERAVFVKDMAYHVAAFATQDFVTEFRNAFLIREPVAALTSLGRKWPDFTDEEVGFDSLASLMSLTEQAGQDLVVIDRDDLCCDPAGIVRAYCERMAIPFLEDALSWSPGMRPEWARWADWHEKSAASTGFGPRDRDPSVSASIRVLDVAARYRPFYDAMWKRRLLPAVR
jgi:hypothetical protein